MGRKTVIGSAAVIVLALALCFLTGEGSLDEPEKLFSCVTQFTG